MRFSNANSIEGEFEHVQREFSVLFPGEFFSGHADYSNRKGSSIALSSHRLNVAQELYFGFCCNSQRSIIIDTQFGELITANILMTCEVRLRPRPRVLRHFERGRIYFHGLIDS